MEYGFLVIRWPSPNHMTPAWGPEQSCFFEFRNGNEYSSDPWPLVVDSYPGSSGIMWCHLGTSGIIWDHVGLSGIL